MAKIRCQIIDCRIEVEAENIRYLKFVKNDGKTSDGHRPVCCDCAKKLGKYKKKPTVKLIYG